MVITLRMKFFTVAVAILASLPAMANTVSDAKKSLNGILKSYSEGQIEDCVVMVDPAMLGFQQLVDSMRTSAAGQKQVRIQLKNTRTTTGKDIVVIRTAWEKRFLKLPDLAPQVSKGETLFLMQLFKKEWKLSSQSGDNIFAM